MLLLENITDDPLQEQIFVLPDGGQVTIIFYYMPMQYGWFIRSLNYENFTLTNFRICNSPNMLHQFKNKIPFGLACFTDGKREPTQQEDFLNQASKLYFLEENEVEELADYFSGL